MVGLQVHRKTTYKHKFMPISYKSEYQIAEYTTTTHKYVSNRVSNKSDQKLTLRIQ